MASPKSTATRKHSLTSPTLVILPEEHAYEFEEVFNGFLKSLQPQGEMEEALVLRLAHAHWRSLRLRRIEAGMLKVSATTQRNRARQLVENCPENLNPHDAIGVGFMTMPPENWQMYLRYDTTVSRDFFRTLEALTRLQRARQTRTPKPDAREPKPALARAAGARAEMPAELSDSGIRSVSRNKPAASDAGEKQAPPSTWGKPFRLPASGAWFWPARKPQRPYNNLAKPKLTGPGLSCVTL